MRLGLWEGVEACGVMIEVSIPVPWGGPATGRAVGLRDGLSRVARSGPKRPSLAGLQCACASGTCEQARAAQVVDGGCGVEAGGVPLEGEALGPPQPVEALQRLEDRFHRVCPIICVSGAMDVALPGLSGLRPGSDLRTGSQTAPLRQSTQWVAASARRRCGSPGAGAVSPPRRWGSCPAS